MFHDLENMSDLNNTDEATPILYVIEQNTFKISYQKRF